MLNLPLLNMIFLPVLYISSSYQANKNQNQQTIKLLDEHTLQTKFRALNRLLDVVEPIIVEFRP